MEKIEYRADICCQLLNYYASLLTKLRENIKLKRRGMLNKGVLLQHDNASSHTCVAATSKLAELAFQILPHPPYSPNLAPSDYHLFKNLKQHLRGTHFKDNESVQIAVTQWLEDQNADFYKEGF
jgi:histone-lysine N-methyltransferase SETMAR